MLAIIAIINLLGVTGASAYELHVGDPDEMKILSSPFKGTRVHASGVFYCRKIDTSDFMSEMGPTDIKAVIFEGEVYLHSACQDSKSEKLFRIGTSGEKEKFRSGEKLRNILRSGEPVTLERPSDLFDISGVTLRLDTRRRQTRIGFSPRAAVLIVWEPLFSRPEFEYRARQSVVEYIDFSREVSKIQEALRERRHLPKGLMPNELIVLSEAGREIRKTIESAMEQNDTADIDRIREILEPMGLLAEKYQIAGLLPEVKKLSERGGRRSTLCLQQSTETRSAEILSVLHQRYEGGWP